MISVSQYNSSSASKDDPMISLFLASSICLLTSDLISNIFSHSSSENLNSPTSVQSWNHSRRWTDFVSPPKDCQASSAVKESIGLTHLSKAWRILESATWEDLLASESALAVYSLSFNISK